jgi:hypothetical protein
MMDINYRQQEQQPTRLSSQDLCPNPHKGEEGHPYILAMDVIFLHLRGGWTVE